MVTIRLMSIDDYDYVYALWLNTPGMGLNTLDDSREGIDKYLKRNPTSCFVALCDGDIIGVILSGHDGRRGYIYHLAVLPDYRNQKIGKNLVNHAISALAAEGISKVSLVAYKANDLGNAFGDSMGFSLRDDLVYRNKPISLPHSTE